MDPRRQTLVEQVRTAIAPADSETDILRAAVDVIDAFSEHFNWTGFYMMRGDVLEVGPYIGPVTEHTRIALNKGICGAAASQKQSIIVDDVRADKRFMACSLSTRSEIVVPLMDGDVCLGEIDIDSDKPSYFTTADRAMLEQVAKVVVEKLKAVTHSAQ